MNLSEILAKVVILLIVGFGLTLFTEIFIEYFIKPIIQIVSKIDGLTKGITIKYLTLLVGLGLVWFVNYDLFTPLLGEFNFNPYPLLGRIISGIIVGGGAPLIHAWIEKWRGGKSLRTTGIKSP